VQTKKKRKKKKNNLEFSGWDEEGKVAGKNNTDK
jgi:hypothetical protein